jgi:hypothetical protein
MTKIPDGPTRAGHREASFKFPYEFYQDTNTLMPCNYVDCFAF